jgi:type VI protein secretion system component VasK
MQPEVDSLASLIWAIVAVLVILWLAGVGFHIGGSLIFFLLLLAIIGVVYQLSVGMRAGRRHHHHATEVSEVEPTDV